MKEILVLAEHRKGELREVTFELLSLAADLAAKNDQSLTVLLLGNGLQNMIKELSQAADKIFVLDDPLLTNYNADHYLAVLEMVFEQRQPELVLIGHSATGTDLAAAFAARVNLPLVTDCTTIDYSQGLLSVMRQIYGGKIEAQLSLKPAQHYTVTVRTGAYPARQALGRAGCIEELSPPSWTCLKGRHFLGYIESKLEDVDITDADILVAVGRGVGKADNIPLIQEFADTIGATLACSRPVADKNWLPKSRQVGTSGKTVRPKVYLALGISGAFQHEAGMKNSGTIIAVNKDPRAPIFNVAHYGIVADMFDVLPKLKARFG